MKPADTAGAPALRLLMVAGEASGDVHGASLAREMRTLAPHVELLGIGGDRMERRGVRLLYHYRRLAVVGLTEVLAHLGDVRRAMRRLVDTVRHENVDGVVLLDYPDFNLALARRLRRVRPGLPIVYYISPQVWAWRQGRVKTIAALVDRMLVILPFEADLYAATGLPVDFVGHPLLDSIPPPESRESFAARHHLDAGREWIALVPGSREAEVERLLPPMLGAARRLAAREGEPLFLVAGAGSVEEETYERALRHEPRLAGRVHRITDDTWGILRHARGAVVCSGTATLETALAGTPLVVVYRTSWLTYNLGKLLVRIRDIGLVNVVGGRRGVPELLQGDVTPKAIERELAPLLEDGPARSACLEFLAEVRERLGRPGASARAAAAVLATIGGGGSSSGCPAGEDPAGQQRGGPTR